MPAPEPHMPPTSAIPVLIVSTAPSFGDGNVC
jgi:hypothetical protein